MLFGGLLLYTAEIAAEELGWAGFVKRLIKEGIGVMSDVSANLWLSYGFLFFLGAAISLWIDSFIRAKYTVTVNRETRIRETIRGRLYANERVLIDGKRFENCTFRNARIVFNGGEMEFDGCTFDSLLFETEVLEADRVISLLHEMGMLNGPMLSADGERIRQVKDQPNDQLKESTEGQ